MYTLPSSSLMNHDIMVTCNLSVGIIPVKTSGPDRKHVISKACLTKDPIFLSTDWIHCVGIMNQQFAEHVVAAARYMAQHAIQENHQAT
jgi:hypothetical protein